MFNILNNLSPFIENCYRKISVREYSNLIKVVPATSSKLLKSYEKQGLLKSYSERRFIFFYANRDSMNFIDLARIYWRNKIEKTGILEKINKESINPVLVLFGSLAKAENKLDSDMDLAIITKNNKKIDLTNYEQKMKRKIQIFQFSSIQQSKNKHLTNNIINGYIIQGKVILDD